MADITHALMIKYGLRPAPTQAEAERWAREVEGLKKQGVPADEAGKRAAKAIFPSYETMKYASHADTIEALLAKVRDK